MLPHLMMFLVIVLHLNLNKTGVTGNNSTKNVKTMVPSKYLSNFWRTINSRMMAFK